MDTTERDEENRTWLVETWAPAMMDWHRRYGPKLYGIDGSVHHEDDLDDESSAQDETDEGTNVAREASPDDHLEAAYDDRWEVEDHDPSWG